MSNFRLAENIPAKWFKITDTMADVDNWKAKTILANSMGTDDNPKGYLNKIGYVMISLVDNTIIPISRADEHRQGYELLRDFYAPEFNIISSDYFSLWVLGNNYPYDQQQAEELKIALTKAQHYGLDLSKIRVYMPNIDKLFQNATYEKAFVSATEFLSGNYGYASFGETITPLGKSLVNAFEELSKTFEKKNVRGNVSISALKMAVKKLYATGQKISMEGKWKFLNILDLEEMNDVLEEYKSGYFDTNKLYTLFFGFNGFRNRFHQRLRKLIADEDVNKQLGSVNNIIEMISAI